MQKMNKEEVKYIAGQYAQVLAVYKALERFYRIEEHYMSLFKVLIECLNSILNNIVVSEKLDFDNNLRCLYSDVNHIDVKINIYGLTPTFIAYEKGIDAFNEVKNYIERGL